MGTDKWILDPNHSELTFKIRHLMISNVSGIFRDFEVTATTLNDDFSQVHVILTAPVASIDTKNEQRDKHLLSADFFDAEHFPELKFESTGIEKSGEDGFRMYGNLTLKGVTKAITLALEYGGMINGGERHGTKAGFTVSGTLNRLDWGINFNRVLETGGVGLGEQVKIFGEIQLVKQM